MSESRTKGRENASSAFRQRWTKAELTSDVAEYFASEQDILSLVTDSDAIFRLSNHSPRTWSVLVPGRKSDTVDPGVNDDVTAGFDVHSTWVNTTSGDIFLCANNADGAAVWTQINGGGGGGSIGVGVDNRLARYNGTTAIQSSGIDVDDTNNLSGIADVSCTTVSASGTIVSDSTVTGTGFIIDNASGTLLFNIGANDPTMQAGTVDPSAGGGIAAAEGSLYLRFVATDGQLWLKTGAANTAWTQITTGGGGGIGAGTDNRLARYNGTNAIQESGITIDDSDNVTGVNTLAVTTPTTTENLVELTHASAASGDGLNIDMPGDASGPAIRVTHGGTTGFVPSVVLPVRHGIEVGGAEFGCPSVSGRWGLGPVSGPDLSFNGSSLLSRRGILFNSESLNIGGAASNRPGTVNVANNVALGGSVVFTNVGGQPQILAGTVDPSAGGGVAAPEGSLFLRYVIGNGELWGKTAGLDTNWTQIV